MRILLGLGSESVWPGRVSDAWAAAVVTGDGRTTPAETPEMPAPPRARQ